MMKIFLNSLILMFTGLQAFGQSEWNQNAEIQQVYMSVEPLIYGTTEGVLYADVYCTVDASTLAFSQKLVPDAGELGVDDTVWEAELRVAIQLAGKIDTRVFTFKGKDSATGAPLLIQKSTFVLEGQRINAGLDSLLDLKVTVMDVFSDWERKLETEIEVPLGAFVTRPLIVESVTPKISHSIYKKWGVDLVPIPAMGAVFLQGETSKMRWYAEAYVDTAAYVSQYRLVNAVGKTVAGTSGFKRLKAGPNPIISELDLSGLSSGRYEVQLKLLNGAGETVQELESAFWWTNVEVDSIKMLGSLSGYDRDAFENGWGQWSQVHDYLGMIAPIVPVEDRRILMNLKEAKDTGRAAAFLVNYWKDRAGQSALVTWKQYLEIVDKVDKEFGSKTLSGWKTHMGRVFLQYGAPSTVETRPFDGKNYPYQIWQYDELKSPSTPTQQNEVFIFVDQELIGRQFTLIHSSAIGEIKDHKWQYHLQRHTNAGPDIDATSTRYNRDNFGERISNSLIIGNQGTWFDNYNR